MTFHAVIGPQTLKTFTKALICLSRYGDAVVIQATSEAFCLSATNSSKSAFCRIRLTSEYFDKFKFKVPTEPGMTYQTPPDVHAVEKITGQVLVKCLLSILKHKTIEKTVDRCDLSIVEGGQDLHPNVDADADEDGSLASKLVIRLHCKHGVVKTHRLLLTQTDLIAPHIASSSTESQVTIGPRTLKDMLEHFPHSKSSKSDPQLVWLFAANDVKVKSMELSGAKSRSQISTEISMSADDFDTYMVCNPPVSLAFHLREFNATIALAESLSVALDLRFTESAAPIFIEFDTSASDSDYLFVISTSQAVFDSPSTSGAANLRKRGREDENEGTLQAIRRKSLRAAVNATAAASAPQQRPGSINPGSASRTPAEDIASISGAPAQLNDTEPLFMPGASQLSHADLDVLRGSGLGIEHMNYDEFEAMMEDEGEEVGMSTAVRNDENVLHMDEGDQEWNGADEDLEHDQMGPSQVPVKRRGEKEFRPLFED